MKLSDLLSKIPESKWSMQLLSDCITEIKHKRLPEPHSEVSFVTREITQRQVLTDSGKVGMIVWIDRETFIKETNS